MGAIGAGAVVGGLGLASIGDVSRKALLAVTSAGGFSGFLVLFSQATTQHVALPLLFLLGVTQVVCVASLNTTLQVRVSDAMRGRIMSLITLCFFGLSTLGSLILGWIGDRVGIADALGAGGLMIAALAAIIVVWRPAMYAPVRPRESVVSSR